MTSDKLYATPEGFELSRPLLLPDARSFSDVLEYHGEWDFATMSSYAGKAAKVVLVEPRYIDTGENSSPGNQIGPFCTVELPDGVPGGPSRRSIAVRATDAVMDVVAPRIVTPDDHLSFKIIGHHGRNRALVILQHGYIIGSHWLAYIDPATIPATR